MSKLVNFTPHAITLMAEGVAIEIPPCGQVARVAVERRTVGSVRLYVDREYSPLFGPIGPYVETYAYGARPVDVPLTVSVFGAVEGLPEPAPCATCGYGPDSHGPGNFDQCVYAPETLYIVSRVVAEACPNRADLVIPDDAVRDGAGRVAGCRALARISGR